MILSILDSAMFGRDLTSQKELLETISSLCASLDPDAKSLRETGTLRDF
jgi:hypothetical protein